MLEIGFKIFMDFSTKLGSSNSACSNASKYTFPSSIPRKQVVDAILRKHFCQWCHNKNTVARISHTILWYSRVLWFNYLKYRGLDVYPLLSVSLKILIFLVFSSLMTAYLRKYSEKKYNLRKNTYFPVTSKQLCECWVGSPHLRMVEENFLYRYNYFGNRYAPIRASNNNNHPNCVQFKTKFLFP